MTDDAKIPLLSGERSPSVQYASTNGPGPEDDRAVKASDIEVEVDPVPTRELHVYKRRFYILILFSAFSACQNGIWNTFGPISAVVEDMFGWDDTIIFLFTNYGPIAYIVSSLAFSWLMQKKGMRWSVLISAGLVAVGAALRCITSSSPWVAVGAHTAQIFNGLAGPVAMAGPPVISSIWFPAGQRTTATGFSLFLSVSGLAASFIMGPYLVPQRNSTAANSSNLSSLGDIYLTSLQNQTGSDISAEKADFMIYMYIAAAAAGAVFILIILYFPDKPPQSPSMSAAIARDSFWQGLRNLFRKVPFWQIGFVYGVTQGVMNCWSGLLDVNLKPHGIDQNEAGWIGFYSTMGSCVGGLVMSRFSDKFVRYMKWITLVLYILGLLSFGWFTLILVDVLPSSTVVLYVTVILGNTAIGSTCPLLYEMGCECAYPVAEGTANGVLTTLNNLAGLLFLLAKFIPNIGIVWMNWTLLGAIALSLPMLLFMRDSYNRLKVDEVSPLPPPT